MPSLRHGCPSLSCCLFLLLSLTACANQSSAPEENSIAYQGEALPSYVSQLLGTWDLWQDGEGGLGCVVKFSDQAILGGFALDAEPDCASKLELGEDPYAWFVTVDGQLIIIDGARQALLRMTAAADGSFKDRRDGDYINAVLLTRP